MELHRRVSSDPIRFKWLRAGSIPMSRNGIVKNPISQEVIRLKASLSQLKNEKTGLLNGILPSMLFLFLVYERNQLGAVDNIDIKKKILELSTKIVVGMQGEPSSPCTPISYSAFFLRPTAASRLKWEEWAWRIGPSFLLPVGSRKSWSLTRTETIYSC